MFLIDSFCRLPKLDGFKPSSLSAADIERASGDACRLQTKGKEAGLATRPSPVFEQLLLSYCSLTQPSVALVLRDNFVQLEDRQEHRDYDTAHDYAEENDQHWLN